MVKGFSVKKRKFLITGGNGFVGKNLIKCFKSDYDLCTTVKPNRESFTKIQTHKMNIDADSDWGDVLEGVDCVIHTAAAVHLKNKNLKKSTSKIFEVNTEGTLKLAKQAAKNGVKRFIFISTVGVIGNANETPFTESDPPRPSGAYAQSKWLAEEGLWKLSKKTDMEVVIIRPPMVYGQNAPGNFAELIKVLNIVRILPFASIENRRTFLHIDNLVSLIHLCTWHPKASNQLFLAGDSEDLSTTVFIKLTASALGKKCVMICFPEIIMRSALALMGQEKLAQRLFDSLRIDTAKARTVLGWEPVVSIREGLKRSVKIISKKQASI